jgi:hypothetical protein
VLIGLLDYRILLLLIAGVLLTCGGVLAIQPRQAPDDREPQAARQETTPDDQPA